MKDESKKKKVEKLLQEYAEYQKTQKEAGSAMKEIELELLELAEENPRWFDGKTAVFENGKLRWVQTSSVKVPDDFDLKAFQKKYPALVEVKVTESIPVSKLKVYLDDPKMGTVIADMGVEIVTKDSFKVEPNKLKVEVAA